MDLLEITQLVSGRDGLPSQVFSVLVCGPLYPVASLSLLLNPPN